FRRDADLLFHARASWTDAAPYQPTPGSRRIRTFLCRHDGALRSGGIAVRSSTPPFGGLNPTLGSNMPTLPKIGILTFHRCINYGSYWQARCLIEGLRRMGADAVLLDHDSAA